MDAESSLETADTAIGINMLLGLWITFSPFLLRFRNVLPAVWNNVGVGLIVVVFSGIRISVGYTQPGWSWCTALFGLWLVVSPFALRFSSDPTPMWNDAIVGLVVVFLSWKGTSTPGLREASWPDAGSKQRKESSAPG